MHGILETDSSRDTIRVMKYKIFILIIFTFFSSSIFAADVSNTGFIPGQIWYSQEPLVEGQTVKVYTAIWNGDSQSINADVEFYDKNVILGSRKVVVQKDSIQTVYVNWKVTAGDHVISAKIISSSIPSASGAKNVVLSRSQTREDRRFVPKLIEQLDGTPVTSTVVIKDKIAETSANLSDFLPESVGVPISGALSSVDDFRDQTFTKIESSKEKTKKTISDISNSSSDTPASSGNKIKADSESADLASPKTFDGTQKPIEYIKLFFLTIIGFIFGNPVVFYIAIVLVIFLLCRYIYRKVVPF
jgi:hypothetical protein